MDIDHMPRFRLCGIMGRALFAAGLSASIGAPAAGQTAPRPIGNAVVDLSPPLPRPSGPSCTVTLFDRRDFQGDEPLPLAYRPPADCPGPWRKVVLEADFDVTTGTQFDRSADLTLGGATLFLGTTMEPGDTYAPHWQVARDVTDYAALLRTPTDGRATLVNYLDKDHDAHVHWGARLVFYAGEAPRPDGVVLPVTAGLARLDPQKPMVSRTIRFPRNLTRLAAMAPAVAQGFQPLNVHSTGSTRSARWDAEPRDAVLQRLLEKVAGYRDERTGKHTTRMAQYAATIAHHHGLSLDQQDLLLGAAPLHDIGKIGLPDSVLVKPSGLTEIDRARMESHTTIGYELLRDEASPLLQLGAEIALSHHERWDGTGYPLGLAGQNIPLSGRIVALADFLDALTTVRPFRPAWLIDKAAASIESDCGRRFDPALVRAFRAGLDSLRRIKRHFDGDESFVSRAATPY